ncbi:MAG: acyltransferase [Anaerolineae bacterium]|jgi:acetyltransferase-like isoleucine patch superfamily enzyme
MIEFDPQYQAATMARGLRGNVLRYVERVSGSRAPIPYLWQGLVLTLLSGMPTVVGSVLRGLAYRAVLEGVGSGCFIEKDVRWQVPRRIRLGRRVMIGEGCFLDAHSLDGRIVLGDDVWLSRGCYVVAYPGVEVRIEDQAYIGHRCLLYGHGGIRVGRDVLMANDVQLICGNHTFARRDVPIRAQPTVEQPIVVEEDVWLGASAIVLGGVTVGRGSVVGAGAVLTHDLPPYSIARGVPARVVGVRGHEPT